MIMPLSLSLQVTQSVFALSKHLKMSVQFQSKSLCSKNLMRQHNDLTHVCLEETWKKPKVKTKGHSTKLTLS